jgi:hypothetical protein
MIVFLCGVALMRKTVLPGLIALACVPLAGMWLEHDPARAVLLSFWVVLVIIAHRKNLVEEIVHLTRHDEHPETDRSRL